MTGLPILRAAVAILAFVPMMGGAEADAFDVAYAALTPGQHARIAGHVRREGQPSIAGPNGFVAAVGSLVPADVPLHWMHPEPGLSRFRYAVIDGQAVVVEPNRRRVLGLVAMTSR